MTADKNIYVTQPSLPPIDEFERHIREIWQSKILTNQGEFHRRLEAMLCEYFGVEYISLFSNGTLALLTALKVAGLQKKEVITTPYTFVATAHALVWNGFTPVFVDIDRKTLNLDPIQVERAITSDTSAILPVHVYGYPCDVDNIDRLAKRHKLKVIYDAAHAFGVDCHCGQLLQHGDLSVLSFHATKVFNTAEGGAIVCRDAHTKRAVDELKNFGFTGETTVDSFGLNGKMSELSAALGCSQIPYITSNRDRRRAIDYLYRQKLRHIQGINCQDFSAVKQPNYGYFPIFVEADYPLSRDELYRKLKSFGIYARRYFYPIVPEFMAYKSSGLFRSLDLPVAKDIASKVICLPIYADLESTAVDRIVDVISPN